MREQELWRPSKFEIHEGALRASRNRRDVAVHSRLIIDLIASFYDAAIPKHASGRLLDLGCGKVPLFGRYGRYASTVTCVDWGNSLHRNPHLDAEVDLTKPLPFPDGAFDTVLLSDVLEHIPNPQDACQEIGRILARDGKLLMNVPFYYWLHEQPYDFYRYTEFALRRLMEQAKLRVLELEALGGAPEVLADVLCKSLCHLPKVGEPMSAAGQALAGWLTRSRLGKRLTGATRQDFPLMYGLVAQR